MLIINPQTISDVYLQSQIGYYNSGKLTAGAISSFDDEIRLQGK